MTANEADIKCPRGDKEGLESSKESDEAEIKC